MLPTGVLTSNETYAFMLAHLYWTPQHEYSLLIESSSHLFPFALLTGTLTKVLGYELANAALLLLSATLFAVGFSKLLSHWKMSSLDALIILCLFVAFGQQFFHFGGEWLFRDFEGKVAAYIFVFFGLAKALDGKWIGLVVSMAIATYFHFLVGGFWTLVALYWLFTSIESKRQIIHAFLAYSIAILPLVVLILSARIGAEKVINGINTTQIYADRVAHHIDPFSSLDSLKKWLPGFFAIAGCLLASIVMLPLAFDCQRTKTLTITVIGLQAFLILAFIASAIGKFVDIFGNFFLFRPTSLTLLLTIVLALVFYRKFSTFRTPLWAVFCILVPIALWPTIELKRGVINQYFEYKPQVDNVVEAVHSITDEGDIVLIQPGRDGTFPESRLTRLIERPLFADYKFITTEPKNIAVWHTRLKYRESVFKNGCDNQYPIGALVIRNDNPAIDDVIASCGSKVFENKDFSVVDVMN